MTEQALQMKLNTLQLQAKRLSEELNKVSIEILKTQGVLEFLQAAAKSAAESPPGQEK